jgi:regulatory protein
MGLWMGGTVTALKAKAGRKGRVHVYLDGRYAFSLVGVLAARLKLGQEITEGEVDALQREDEVEVAYQRALGLIRRRPRAERELRMRFERARLPLVTQDAVIDRLRQSGLIDDVGFAEAWVENRSAFRPRAARMLRFELRQKGVSGAAIEAALVGYDEEAAAVDAGRKASRRMMQLSEIDFRRRMSQFLARRGFDHATISPVVERLWRETAANQRESEGTL